MTEHGGKRRVLIIVENLSVPFDRRVWQVATTLQRNGYVVSVICPKGRGDESSYEQLDGVNIYRHSLPYEADRALGYVVEYGWALASEIWLSFRVLLGPGFDAIHACNPPDNIFILGALYKLMRKRFLFDHHDLVPELFEAKFGRRGLLYRLMCALERWTFRTADVSIATNESYREIAIGRGRMTPENVFVVRSGPSLERLRVEPPNPELKRGRRYLVGYVGVMGKQEGIDLLLRAVRHLVELGREDIHFGLVGGGTELDGLREMAHVLDVEDFVTFTGRVPDEEMLAMLNTADICVNPDVPNAMNDKSTMNKIMEYMALGKPIVQFDLTEGRRSAQSASLYARCHDVADFAQNIAKLADSPRLRRTMGEYGRRRVETTLEWRHEAPKLLAAYERLFSG